MESQLARNVVATMPALKEYLLSFMHSHYVSQ